MNDGVNLFIREVAGDNPGGSAAQGNTRETRFSGREARGNRDSQKQNRQNNNADRRRASGLGAGGQGPSLNIAA